MADYYVCGKTGNDRTGDGSKERPVRTFRRLQELLPVVSESTTVHLLSNEPGRDRVSWKPIKQPVEAPAPPEPAAAPWPVWKRFPGGSLPLR